MQRIRLLSRVGALSFRPLAPRVQCVVVSLSQQRRCSSIPPSKMAESKGELQQGSNENSGEIRTLKLKTKARKRDMGPVNLPNIMQCVMAVAFILLMVEAPFAITESIEESGDQWMPGNPFNVREPFMFGPDPNKEQKPWEGPII